MNKEKLEEVERLVNDIRNCPECFEYILTSDERTLLIKFICSTIQEKTKLEENRDKAIEYLKSYNVDFARCEFGEAPISMRELDELLEILKGEKNE